AIAVARRPGHDLGYSRPFSGEQKPVLVSEPLQAARGDVVLHPGACRFLGSVAIVVLAARSRPERFHAASPIQSQLSVRRESQNREHCTRPGPLKTTCITSC